jgi:hypothetical protein
LSLVIAVILATAAADVGPLATGVAIVANVEEVCVLTDCEMSGAQRSQREPGAPVLVQSVRTY